MLAFWAVVDLVRAMIQRRGDALSASEITSIDREARRALFLPHLTIIAGGLCLIVLRLGNWMSWGVLEGKVIFEALSFAVGRDTSGETPAA